MARTIALDEHLRDPARVAVASKNGKPKYLHSSLRPLGEEAQRVLTELDVQDRMQGRLFDDESLVTGGNGFVGECEGYCST